MIFLSDHSSSASIVDAVVDVSLDLVVGALEVAVVCLVVDVVEDVLVVQGVAGEVVPSSASTTESHNSSFPVSNTNQPSS